MTNPANRLYSFICFINSTYIKLYQKILKGHGFFCLFYSSQKLTICIKIQDSEAARHSCALLLRLHKNLLTVVKKRIIPIHMALHHSLTVTSKVL